VEIKMGKKLEFVKNVLSVDVDGSRGINHYVIKAQYDAIDEDGFADIVYKIVDDFTMTWKEIEEEGGISAINKDLKECYNV
jgi:hypothetical protein